jgi:hypothetical protein
VGVGDIVVGVGWVLGFVGMAFFHLELVRNDVLLLFLTETMMTWLIVTGGKPCHTVHLWYWFIHMMLFRNFRANWDEIYVLKTKVMISTPGYTQIKQLEKMQDKRKSR